MLSDLSLITKESPKTSRPECLKTSLLEINYAQQEWNLDVLDVELLLHQTVMMDLKTISNISKIYYGLLFNYLW